MRAPKSCAISCMKTLSAKQKEQFIRAIDEEYTVHWIVDNLPVGRYVSNENKDTLFTRGFAVGFRSGTKKGVKHYLYNHIRIIIQYHDDPMEPSKVLFYFYMNSFMPVKKYMYSSRGLRVFSIIHKIYYVRNSLMYELIT